MHKIIKYFATATLVVFAAGLAYGLQTINRNDSFQTVREKVNANFIEITNTTPAGTYDIAVWASNTAYWASNSLMNATNLGLGIATWASNTAAYASNTLDGGIGSILALDDNAAQQGITNLSLLSIYDTVEPGSLDLYTAPGDSIISSDSSEFFIFASADNARLYLGVASNESELASALVPNIVMYGTNAAGAQGTIIYFAEGPSSFHRFNVDGAQILDITGAGISTTTGSFNRVDVNGNVNIAGNIVGVDADSFTPNLILASGDETLVNYTNFTQGTIVGGALTSSGGIQFETSTFGSLVLGFIDTTTTITNSGDGTIVLAASGDAPQVRADAVIAVGNVTATNDGSIVVENWLIGNSLLVETGDIAYAAVDYVDADYIDALGAYIPAFTTDTLRVNTDAVIPDLSITGSGRLFQQATILTLTGTNVSTVVGTGANGITPTGLWLGGATDASLPGSIAALYTNKFKLGFPTTVWEVDVNGNVSGYGNDWTNVSTLAASTGSFDKVTISSLGEVSFPSAVIQDQSTGSRLFIDNIDGNDIWIAADGSGDRIVLEADGGVVPDTSNTVSLGSASLWWSDLYANTIHTLGSTIIFYGGSTSNALSVSTNGIISVAVGTNAPVATVTEAPSNGTQYARQDNGWVAVSGAGDLQTVLDAGNTSTTALDFTSFNSDNGERVIELNTNSSPTIGTSLRTAIHFYEPAAAVWIGDAWGEVNETYMGVEGDEGKLVLNALNGFIQNRTPTNRFQANSIFSMSFAGSPTVLRFEEPPVLASNAGVWHVEGEAVAGLDVVNYQVMTNWVTTGADLMTNIVEFPNGIILGTNYFDGSTGSVSVAAITFDTDFVPTVSNAYDIGSAEKPVKDLYLASGRVLQSAAGAAEVSALTNTVVFPAAFSNIPIVTCTFSTNVGELAQIETFNHATNSFNWQVRTGVGLSSDSKFKIHWIAREEN